MTFGRDPVSLPAALAMARLRAVRTALLPLHRALIELERARYERSNGSLSNPHQVLQLAMSAPSFQWIRPVSTMIVQIDERLADDRPVDDREVTRLVEDVRGLLQRDMGGPEFRHGYQRALQEEPAIVMEHGRVMNLLGEISK